MKCWLALLLVACGVGGFADEMRPFTVGVRGGISFKKSSDTFRQVVGTFDAELPWKWHLGPDLTIQSRLDLSAGWIRGERDEAVIGTLGPSFIFYWRDLPVSAEGGSSPTLMSQHFFGKRDFGVPFQFTSHAGVNWDVTPRVRLGYRFQHMSNAGLGESNPGLNLHMLSVGFRF